MLIKDKLHFRINYRLENTGTCPQPKTKAQA